MCKAWNFDDVNDALHFQGFCFIHAFDSPAINRHVFNSAVLNTGHPGIGAVNAFAHDHFILVVAGQRFADVVELIPGF